MVETKLIILDKSYIPENEYQKLDVCFGSTYTTQIYSIVAAIYESGIILYVRGECNLDDITKRDFPNLYKIMEYCRDNGYKYIDMFNSGEVLDSKTENKYHLKRFEHDT